VFAGVGGEGGGLGGLILIRVCGGFVLGVLPRKFAVVLAVAVTLDTAESAVGVLRLSPVVGICGFVTLVLTSLPIAQLHSPVSTSLGLWCRRSVVQWGCLVHPRMACLDSVIVCQ
jgi:hypothetical protein